MIRPLRQRHRATVYTLGLLLPVVFAAGIAARKTVPVVATLPSGLTGQTNDFGRVIWTKTDLWPAQRIITHLHRDAAGSVAVELMFRDLVKPDILVYWAAGNETAGEKLPDNARLLGVLSNRTPLPIPGNARGESGRLVLYSLADHEVVAASKAFILSKN